MVTSVVRRGALLGATGVALGMGAAAIFGGRIGPLLFATSATDIAVFGVVAVLLVLTSVVAALIPALRAVRLDPAAVLRGD